MASLSQSSCRILQMVIIIIIMVMFALATKPNNVCVWPFHRSSSPSPPMPARDNDHQLASNINELVLIAQSPAGQARPSQTVQPKKCAHPTSVCATKCIKRRNKVSIKPASASVHRTDRVCGGWSSHISTSSPSRRYRGHANKPNEL